MNRIIFATVALLCLSACTTPRARLENGLIKAGLSERTSACMSEYMIKRLDIGQLRKLQSLASVSKVDYRRITLHEYLHKVRALEDTELLAVTGKAALHCAI